jgi:hypothetical protein
MLVGGDAAQHHVGPTQHPHRLALFRLPFSRAAQNGDGEIELERKI